MSKKNNELRLVDALSLKFRASLVLFFALTHTFTVAQNLSFGPLFGTYIPKNTGFNRVGDVVIITESDSGDGERMIGIFFEYKITDRVAVRSELQYFPIYTSFIVYNEAEVCSFCPVRKGALLTTSNISLTPTFQFNFIQSKNFHIGASVGPSLFFQNSKEEGDFDFGWGSLHPGVQETINAIDETAKTVVFYGAYGLFISYKRITFQANRLTSLSKSFTQPLEISGSRYNFKSKASLLTFGLSYRFYSLRKKNQ